MNARSPHACPPKVYQTRFGDPSGNCTEAALATIVGCQLEDVPDLWVAAGRPTEPGGRDNVEAISMDNHWQSQLDRWLRHEHQRRLCLIPFPGGGWFAPDGMLVLASGPSRANGLGHMVVMRTRWQDLDERGFPGHIHLALYHDPHPGWDGLAEVEHLYFVTAEVG